MIRRHWKKILGGILASVIAFALFGVPYLMARLVTRAGTRPMDMRLTSAPTDFGVDFEDVTFSSSDGVELSGWYLGGGDGGLTIACGHGLFRSRREVLDRAVFFRRLGFDTLVFDFRRHGTSATREKVTLGYDERLDFLGAVDFLKRAHPDKSVAVYGVSMGAAAALLAARASDDVSAVMADSSFLSIDHTVEHHVELLFGLPRFPFASTLLFFFQQQAGFDAEDFDLEKAAEALGDRPLLVVAGESDQRMPAALQRRLFDASSSPSSRFRSFPDAGHGAAYRTHPDAYEKMLVEFLEEAGFATRPESRGPEEEDSSPESR